MATHPTNKDPIAKIVLVAGLLMLLVTVFVLLSSLFSTIDKNSLKGEVDTDTLVANNAAMIESTIKPIGEVTTSDGSGAVAAGPARSGEEVYSAVCQACHGTGAAGAPKIDDNAAWKPRVAKGFDALMTTAINGKGAMPARGGQNVPDAELKAAIAFMTTKAGFSLDIPSDKQPEADTADKPKAEKETTEASDTASQVKTEATTPEAEVSDTADEAASSPTATTETTTSEEKSVAEQTDTVTTGAAPVEKEETAKQSSTSGKEIYQSTCFACHGLGVAGAPKIGDHAAWEKRVPKGKEVLYTSAIKGIQGETGVMPPKGGNFSLTDEEVKAAVDYMVSEVK